MGFAGIEHTTPLAGLQQRLADYRGVVDVGSRRGVGEGGDDTAALQEAIYEGIDRGVPVFVSPAKAGAYNISTLLFPEPVGFFGQFGYVTRFNRVANGVSGTAVGGGSLTSGTYYIMIFGLDAGNVVQGAYAPYPVTVNGSSTTAIQMTWPAISGSTKYRLWIGTTRYLQSSYFEVVAPASTYTVTSSSGTGGSRPSFDSPMFDCTPGTGSSGRDAHGLFSDFALNGSNRASHAILWRGDSSYKYAGRHYRIWAEFFYDSVFEARSAAAFGRWHDVVGRNGRVAFYISSSDDHQIYNCDAGDCDYGIDILGSVNTEIFSFNGYTCNFAAYRCQATANRNHMFGGSLNLNKQAGAILGGEQNSLFGTKFSANSSLLANTYSDIVATGDANYVCGPQFIAGATLPKYNYEVTGAITLDVVRPNFKGTTFGTAVTNDATKLLGAFTSDADAVSTGYVIQPDATGVLRRFMIRG